MTEGYALTATELSEAAGARSLPSMVAVEANDDGAGHGERRGAAAGGGV